MSLHPCATPFSSQSSFSLSVSNSPFPGVISVLVLIIFRSPLFSRRGQIVFAKHIEGTSLTPEPPLGHADHILPWFQGGLDGEPAHDTCPVSLCECECANT